MKGKYQRLLTQNKIWVVAALILPSISTLTMVLLTLFNFDSYLKIFTLSIIVIFFTVASYWWWWTMYQLYLFTKNVGTTEEKIETLGKEFQSIKDDIKKL